MFSKVKRKTMIVNVNKKVVSNQERALLSSMGSLSLFVREAIGFCRLRVRLSVILAPSTLP